MRKYMRYILITFLFFSTNYFFEFHLFAQDKSTLSETSFNVVEFNQLLKASKSPQLIDVRTPEEYRQGHLKDALNVDWNSDDFDRMIQALDKDQPVYVYCLSGGRSASAAEKMRNSGFKEVFEMKGGILAWNKSGNPTVSKKDAADPNLSLEDLIKNFDADKLLLIDFNAPWCAPCKKMAPFLEELAKTEKEKMELLKVNVDEHKKLAASMEVYILPTLILYKDDKVVWRHEGFIDKEGILEIIRNNE